MTVAGGTLFLHPLVVASSFINFYPLSAAKLCHRRVSNYVAAFALISASKCILQGKQGQSAGFSHRVRGLNEQGQGRAMGQVRTSLAAALILFSCWTCLAPLRNKAEKLERTFVAVSQMLAGVLPIWSNLSLERAKAAGKFAANQRRSA